MKIVINDVLGEVSWSLRRSRIILFTLFCTFLRCKLKSNLVSNIIPRCFWVDDDLTKFPLKYNGGWSILLIFLLKITSWACFLGSRLNLIFHWKAVSLIFIKSLFRSFAVESPLLQPILCWISNLLSQGQVVGRLVISQPYGILIESQNCC